MAIRIAPAAKPKPADTLRKQVKIALGGSKTRVGRPSSGKVRVTLRLSPDVVAKFKATGPGWQARIDETLKSAMGI